MYNRNEIKKAYANWFNDKINPKIFATLTFSKDVSKEFAITKLTIAMKRLRTSIFGYRNKKQLPMFCVYEECSYGRPHFHIIIGESKSISIKSLKEKIIHYWHDDQFSPIKYNNNDDWFKTIDEQSKKNAINYALKQMYRNSDKILVELIQI